MAKGTISMRKIKEILRLQASGLKQRQIARSLNLSIGVVNKYLHLAQEAKVTWPLPEDMDEVTLKAILLKQDRGSIPPSYILPDCEWIHRELKHKGVTLQLLHKEYKSQYPQGHYQYTQFCHTYREWSKKQHLSLRQIHKAGEEMFVDYAGPKVPITDLHTREVSYASIFVAVLGASDYTYVEATWDQSLKNWIGSHVRAFNFFEGVPFLVVPDNLKSGVSNACRYDPDINPSYAEMIAYYNTAVLPARPYKPRDKPKAENAVLIVERWVLARLRHKVFYSLHELNQAIHSLLVELNNQPFQKIPGSRYSQFKELEQPHLKPLPARPYEYAEFKRLRASIDYHIEVEKHYYSVPYQYAREEVDVRLTSHVIEILSNGQRIASHERHYGPGVTTCPAHMTEPHRKHQEWTPESCLDWGLTIGISTHSLINNLFQSKSHPRQVYRLFLGLLKLVKYFGEKRLENACKRAVFYGICSYKKIQAILEKGLDQEPLPLYKEETQPIEHSNIRGSHYYH